MKTYQHKYKLAFFFLSMLVSGLARGQQPIDSMVYTVHAPQYIFQCRKATSIDLFKAANLYVSPQNGYWGDVHGIPYNGKASLPDTIKERKYTDGNIFTPPTSPADTGMYKFYFYFTSAKEYCGIKNGTRFILNLYLGSYGCFTTPATGDLDNSHYFCYDSSVDMNINGLHTFNRPVTVESLLLQFSREPVSWKKDRSMNSDWVEIDVYTDRERTPQNRIGNGDMEVRLDSAYSVTYYVIIHPDNQNEVWDSLNITVYPEPQLEVIYSPDILVDQNREYGIDDGISITVSNSEDFNYFKFLLNDKSLNKYYLGGDTTKNEIVLSALAFSGVEDFLEIIATDKNNCIAREENNVIVRVPFPTVFTPDGDGVNDIFLGGEKFRNREFHLEIHNRWGNRLYSGESGWDGTYRGNKVPPGTYMYVLILKMEDGSSKTVKNTVTLIRER